MKEVGATSGIDKVMNDFNLDALIVPTSCWIAGGFASLAGCVHPQDMKLSSADPAHHAYPIHSYPVCTVPLGVHDDGEPFGLSFVGRKWSEPTLIGLM